MTYIDQHSATSDATAEQAWEVVSGLGGDERLYVPRELWRLRGLADRLVGGPGYRVEGPGRPLQPRDRMDFWEVLDVHPPTRLRLRALSRVPGTIYLDVEVAARGSGSTVLLRSTFEPAGPAGHVYWWSTLAAHRVTFALMVRRLAAMAAEV
ncbi:MAG: hypothetical protein QOF53_4022 [Nocardioidaceae bacterium]|jgi:hypothetical protein|nr:hypothetical protein [Nocardioidaceae bacterium]